MTTIIVEINHCFWKLPRFYDFFWFYGFCKIFRVSRLKNQKPEKTRELMPAKVSALKVGPVCHNWGCAVKRYVGGLEISGFSTAHAHKPMFAPSTFWTLSPSEPFLLRMLLNTKPKRAGKYEARKDRKKWHLCWLVTSLPLYLKSIAVRTYHKWVKKMDRLSYGEKTVSCTSPARNFISLKCEILKSFYDQGFGTRTITVQFSQ